MNLEQTIRAIEAASSIAQVRSLILPHRDSRAFGQAYFELIRSLMGHRPTWAGELASQWRSLSRRPAQSAEAQRVRAVALRIESKWVACAAASIRAGELATTSAERFTYPIGAIDGLGRAGKAAQASQLAERLAAGLLELDDSVNAARVCINAGNAWLWADEHAKAKRWFQKASGLIDREQMPFEWGSIHLALSTIALYIESPRVAAELAEVAGLAFAELELSTYASIARLNLAHARLLAGRADEARELFLDLRRAGGLSAQDQARVEEFLGDCYLRLNLYEEALDAYRTALAHPGFRGLAMNRANAQFGLGQAHWRLGRPDQAAQAWQSAAKGYRKFGNELWQQWAQCWAIQAEPRTPTRTAKLRRLADSLWKKRAHRFAVEAELFVMEAQGPDSSRLQRIRQLRQIISRRGFGDLRWRALWLEARAASGASARRAYRQMVEAILTERASLRSIESRATYFRDKQSALAEYLSQLLASRRPADHREAQRILVQSRSVALLDELLAVSGTSALAELEALREELQGDLSRQADVQGEQRRRSISPPELHGYQRRWNELERRTVAVTEQWAAHSAPAHGQVVLVDAGSRIFAYSCDEVIELDLDWSRVATSLDWLEFELLGPQLDRTASACGALLEAKSLVEQLWKPLERLGRVRLLCPDGRLWRVPWQLLATLEGSGEIALGAGPWWNGCPDLEKMPESVASMYFASPELPHIQREVAIVKQRFPAAASIQASRDFAQLAEVGHIDFLHVAAHASFNPSNPMFSSISLADEAIHAKEIAQSGLRVDRVLLSACESGIMSPTRGTEIEGLTRAFFCLGAKEVLASQWALDDEAAQLMTSVIVERVAGGESMRSALGEARGVARSQFEHPYFWGSMVLTKGYVDQSHG
jgi:tetratricopeptide (TPR) repeat protein